MFDVSTHGKKDNAQALNLDVTPGLKCPEAADLPHPLMTDYQNLLKSKDAHKIKLEESNLSEKDYYSIDDLKAKPSMLTVKTGASPTDTKNVRMLADEFKQMDFYKDGVRDGAQFTPPNSTSEENIVISATLTHQAGKEFISFESGAVIVDRGGELKEGGYFKAAFDANGHIKSYSAGPTLNSLVDETNKCVLKEPHKKHG